MPLEISIVKYAHEILATTRLIRAGIKNITVPGSTINTLANMEKNLDSLIYDLESKEKPKAPTTKSVEKICSQAKNAAQQLIKSKVSENIKIAAVKLLELSGLLSHKNKISEISTGIEFNDYGLAGLDRDKNFRVFEVLDEKASDEFKLKKQLEESEAKAASLSQSITSLEIRTQEEINKILACYEKAATEFELKNGEINNILGKLSGRAIAGDYERSAAGEQRIADYLRAGSLFFMAVIACALIYTFFETTNTEFNWQKSIFRISLTFLLSVPAAYLARESAKHREQQYNHLQTSLDLKAIPPFLATLPEEEQNRFKLEIANRIFGTRETKAAIDSYPINTQEIIMALITKVEDFSSQKPKTKHNEV